MRMCAPGASGTVQGMTDQPHPVLVGIDGTPSGLEALALAGALATLTGSPLLFCAVHGSERGAFGGGLGRPLRDEAQGWLVEAGERLGDTVPWSAQIERASCPLIIVPRGIHPAPRSAASVAEVAHA